MSALLDQLLDPRRAAECKAGDEEQRATLGNNPTTRRFPRTIEEAWPHEAPPLVDGPHSKGLDFGHRVVGYVGAIFLVAFAVHIILKILQ